MGFSVRSVLRDPVGDFRRAWPQLVLTDLLVRSLGVLAPAVGLLRGMEQSSAPDEA
jgi:hypothetical protein